MPCDLAAAVCPSAVVRDAVPLLPTTAPPAAPVAAPLDGYAPLCLRAGSAVFMSYTFLHCRYDGNPSAWCVVACLPLVPADVTQHAWSRRVPCSGPNTSGAVRRVLMPQYSSVNFVTHGEERNTECFAVAVGVS